MRHPAPPSCLEELNSSHTHMPRCGLPTSVVVVGLFLFFTLSMTEVTARNLPRNPKHASRVIRRDTNTSARKQKGEVEVLERMVGDIKGYYIVIIVLAVFTLFLLLGWAYIFRKDRKQAKQRRGPS